MVLGSCFIPFIPAERKAEQVTLDSCRESLLLSHTSLPITQVKMLLWLRILGSSKLVITKHQAGGKSCFAIDLMSMGNTEESSHDPDPLDIRAIS